MTLSSDSNPLFVFAYSRLVVDDGCLCPKCQRVRQLDRRLERLVHLADRLKGQRKARCWEVVRRAKMAQEKAMVQALAEHRGAKRGIACSS